MNRAAWSQTASHHPGRGVADRGDRDARAEIDQPVAVHVLDDPAERARRVDRHGVADAVGDSALLACDQLGGPWAGNRGGEVAALFHSAQRKTSLLNRWVPHLAETKRPGCSPSLVGHVPIRREPAGFLARSSVAPESCDGIRRHGALRGGVGGAGRRQWHTGQRVPSHRRPRTSIRESSEKTDTKQKRQCCHGSGRLPAPAHHHGRVHVLRVPPPEEGHAGHHRPAQFAAGRRRGAHHLGPARAQSPTSPTTRWTSRSLPASSPRG